MATMTCVHCDGPLEQAATGDPVFRPKNAQTGMLETQALVDAIDRRALISAPDAPAAPDPSLVNETMIGVPGRRSDSDTSLPAPSSEDFGGSTLMGIPRARADQAADLGLANGGQTLMGIPARKAAATDDSIGGQTLMGIPRAPHGPVDLALPADGRTLIGRPAIEMADDEPTAERSVKPTLQPPTTRERIAARPQPKEPAPPLERTLIGVPVMHPPEQLPDFSVDQTDEIEPESEPAPTATSDDAADDTATAASAALETTRGKRRPSATGRPTEVVDFDPNAPDPVAAVQAKLPPIPSQTGEQLAAVGNESGGARKGWGPSVLTMTDTTRRTNLVRPTSNDSGVDIAAVRAEQVKSGNANAEVEELRAALRMRNQSEILRLYDALIVAGHADQTTPLEDLLAARVLYQWGMYFESACACKRGRDKNKKGKWAPRALYLQARLMSEHLNMLDDGLRLFQKVLERYPRNEFARRAQEMLQRYERAA